MVGNQKRRKGGPDIEEILARPWCYYCERDFDDLKILINHQRAKHFKCDRCSRRLNTAGGLSVHMIQVHKETLTSIENALPNRSGLEVEIFGMEGIPQEIVNTHNTRVVSQFAQAEAERRAATGNPGLGNANANPSKKPKLESAEELKKRLAEHKAKKAAEEAAGASSGNATPAEPVPSENQGPTYGQQQQLPYAGSPPYPQQQPTFAGPPASGNYNGYSQQYGQPVVPYQQPLQQFPQQPGFPQPIGPYGNQPFPQQQQFPPQMSQGFGPPQFQNGPPQPHYPNGPQAPYQNGMPPMPFLNGPTPPQFQGGPPRFGANSPPTPFQPQGQYPPPRNHTPPQGLPPRQNSLPAAPGLPQRPNFTAPPVNAFQMQQMHQGQIPGSVSMPNHQNGNMQAQNLHSNKPSPVPQEQVSASVPITEPRKTEPPSEKKERKKKEKEEKNIKLVYSDNEISPEEKMASLSRYAFVLETNGTSHSVSDTTATEVSVNA